jgi:PAS domain S-box-containing protein
MPPSPFEINNFLNFANADSLPLLTLPPLHRNRTPGAEQVQFGFRLAETERQMADLQAELQTEIAALKRELVSLRQEKTDLEILLETTAEHSDSVEAELHHTALEALRQSEEWFRTIAEATPVPVLISCVEDSAILYANTAAGAMFGLTTTELLSRRLLEFDHNPDPASAETLHHCQSLLERVQRDGAVQNFELQCQRADGTLFWVAASLRQLTFNQKPTLLTALHDITQRKLEEEALKQQVREMQIEIDQAKRARQLAEIVQTDYFQQLQAEVEQLRYPDQEDE